MKTTTTAELSRRILTRLAQDLGAEEIVQELRTDCDLIRMSALSEDLAQRAKEATHV